MARARGDKEYKLAVSGLNTEANLLDFPPEFAVDMSNMDLEFNPVKLKPRLGVSANTVNGNELQTLTLPAGSTAISYFLWDRASGDEDNSFLCYQIGSVLVFIDANSTDAIDSKFGLFLDLDDVKSGTIKGTSALASSTRLQYSRVKNNLLITSEAIDPTLIRYTASTDTIQFTKLTLKARDTVGLESGIEIDLRPIAISNFPVGDAASSAHPNITEIHHYNLLNQGWYQDRRNDETAPNLFVEPLSNFSTTDTTQYPSNADISYLALEEVTGILIIETGGNHIKGLTFGSTPAARGHYVVDVFNIDRETPRNNRNNSGAFTNNQDWTDIAGS